VHILIKFSGLAQEAVMNDSITHLENICTEFVNTFQDKLTWEWDDRFDAVLAICKAENKDDVQKYLGGHLKTIWNSSSTNDAPDAVLEVISQLGGLMLGQLIFTSDPNQDVILCCAWWPWVNGNTVSIRVAPTQKGLSEEDKVELNKKFKDWFRI
jgi:hypothetical protein